LIILPRIVLSRTTTLLLLLLLTTFVVPTGPLEGTSPPAALADPDSQFADIDGVRVHYKVAGHGEPAIILLHGFGAGEFTWDEVIGPISQYGTVIAYDRPGFGLTERPLPGQWSATNPYSADYQDDLLVGLMDAVGVERALLVGNSAGGNVAAQAALNYPDRVEGLVLVDAAIYGHGRGQDFIENALSIPPLQRVGPLIARVIAKVSAEFSASSWHEPTRLTPKIRADYQKQMQTHNWDYGFWEAGRVGLPQDLGGRLEDLSLPVLVITGDDDRVVPTQDSIRLADELPDADLAIMAQCGHVPNEECPEGFLRAVESFLGQLTAVG
jgi:pimeloyl-ACP methyl ester carboxylesterase